MLAVVIGGALARQVQISADGRLVQGAAAAQSLLDSSRGDLSIAADSMGHDAGLPAPLQAGDLARELERFKTSSGLDLSLSLHGAWVATTLRSPGGAPLAGLQADPATVREVVGSGRSRFSYWSLPGGRVRSYSVPLAGADGDRIGMLSVTLPVATLTSESLQALLAALPLIGLVTLATVAFAYVLLHRLYRPVKTLAVAAARLRSGDLATPIPAVTEPALAPLAQELELARSRLQESLQAAASEEAHLRAIFLALPQPALVADPDGRITDCNPAAIAFFSSGGDFIRQPIQRLLPIVPSRLGDEGQAVAWRGSVLDAHGVAVDVEVLRARLAGGRLATRDVYVVHDVSKFAELNRLREQLLYNVAHELRAPLGILENLFEILEGDYTNLNLAEVDRLLGSGRRTAARIRRLMEDLLSAGSIESGRFSVLRRPTLVSTIIDDGIEAVGGMMEERRQRVAVEVSPPELCALADPGHASRVVSNLVSNASKYGPENELIRVQAQGADGYVRITVEDRGPGIPADQQARLFERFSRRRSPSEAPGIGLGLAIARGIVEVHGGSIGIENGVQEGTRAWFTLPATEMDGEAPDCR